MTQSLIERLQDHARNVGGDESYERLYGDEACEAATLIERQARQIAEAKEALKPFAENKTTSELMAAPPEWLTGTIERRIEIMGERKRKHDGDILRARAALQSLDTAGGGVD